MPNVLNIYLYAYSALFRLISPIYLFIYIYIYIYIKPQESNLGERSTTISIRFQHSFHSSCCMPWDTFLYAKNRHVGDQGVKKQDCLLRLFSSRQQVAVAESRHSGLCLGVTRARHSCPSSKAEHTLSFFRFCFPTHETPGPESLTCSSKIDQLMRHLFKFASNARTGYRQTVARWWQSLSLWLGSKAGTLFHARSSEEISPACGYNLFLIHGRVATIFNIYFFCPLPGYPWPKKNKYKMIEESSGRGWRIGIL